MINVDELPIRFTKQRVAELTSAKHARMPNIRNPSLNPPRVQNAKENSVRCTTITTRLTEETSMKSSAVIREQAAHLKTK